ncbi:peptidyl-prolyl cis-trans isomerase [Bacillus aerolatus]|uniref:Peptidyl-prolyl cis-trans isomerase n=1 Tax=Bacillus aerolatus TaxID=2653354 RepID=A0A6I1FHL8_9BACI|nr:peptidyl-prolyl cis-trans isomerase [Bacillus aerolatus]KAB7707931.1 peptidyl-prolyl cis-trans isomerase [Bacillus aerolatus]
MENIMPIKGNVKFPVTLDPGVWIFDDRRIDLNTYFDTKESSGLSAEEEYTKNISKFWDKEIREGAVFPPTIKSEKKFEKEKVLTGTFGIPFEPFLKNAEPDPAAQFVVIETAGEEVKLPVERAHEIILAFSKEGKPLREDGPVHVLFKDGSNRNEPIQRVKAFRIE